METIGRLKDGIAFRRAQAMFKGEVLHQNAKAYEVSEVRNWPKLVSLQNQLAGPVRQQTWVLTGMALLVLLTACANVTQLILSRATERRQELTVRAALGASRARLLQQLITEAVVFTSVSTTLGLILAQWICTAATAIVPPQLATQRYTTLDWRVLAFAAGLAVASGIVFGISSTHLTARIRLATDSLRSQQGASSPLTKRLGAGLIVMQTAITLCLVTCSFALGAAFLKLVGTDLGYRTANVVTLNVSLQGTRHSGKGKHPYYREALSRLREMPAVEAASAVSYLPLATDVYMANAFKLDSGQKVAAVVTNSVMPDYFRAMGTEFLKGRDFEKATDQYSDRRVIVNETFAQLSGLGNGITGRHVISPWTGMPYQIVGVVKDMRLNGPENGGGPQIYFFIGQVSPPALTLVAKVRGNAAIELMRSRDAVRRVDPQVPIYDVKTLDQRLNDVLARPRFYMAATGLLSFMTALLAMVGIYGTTSYALEQRCREMGIRMAVGATAQRLRNMMIWESVRPLLPGAVGGVVLTIFVGRFLGALLTSVARPTLWACLVGATVLLCVGVVASWRATAVVMRIDPAEALRAE
jgi:predicted permease